MQKTGASRRWCSCWCCHPTPLLLVEGSLGLASILLMVLLALRHLAIHNSLVCFLKFCIHLLSFFVHCQLLNQIYQSVQKNLSRGLQRDVVYLGWPKAPSHMSPNAGAGGELRGLSQWVQLYIGAQINFGDLTPYLTFDCKQTADTLLRPANLSSKLTQICQVCTFCNTRNQNGNCGNCSA